MIFFFIIIPYEVVFTDDFSPQLLQVNRCYIPDGVYSQSVYSATLTYLLTCEPQPP